MDKIQNSSLLKNLGSLVSKGFSKVRAFFGGKQREIAKTPPTSSLSPLRQFQSKAEPWKKFASENLKSSTPHGDNNLKLSAHREQSIQASDEKEPSDDAFGDCLVEADYKQLVNVKCDLPDDWVTTSDQNISAEETTNIPDEEDNDEDYLDFDEEPSVNEPAKEGTEGTTGPVKAAQLAAPQKPAAAVVAFKFTPPTDRVITEKAGVHVLEYIKNDGNVLDANTDVAKGIQDLMDASVKEAAGALGDAALKLANIVGLNFDYVKKLVLDATDVDMMQAVTEKNLVEAEKDLDTLIDKFRKDSYKQPSRFSPINRQATAMIASACKNTEYTDSAYAVLLDIHLKELQRNPHANHKADIERLLGKIDNQNTKAELQQQIDLVVTLAVPVIINDYKLDELSFAQPQNTLKPALKQANGLIALLGNEGNQQILRETLLRSLSESAKAYCKQMADPAATDSIDAFYTQLEDIKTIGQEAGEGVTGNIATKCERWLQITVGNALLDGYSIDDLDNSNGLGRNDKIAATLAHLKTHNPMIAGKIQAVFEQDQAKLRQA